MKSESAAPSALTGSLRDPELGRPVEPVLVLRREGPALTPRRDALAVEEPLEVRLGWPGGGEPRRLLVTMRTPGADADLVAGLLFSEGLIDGADDLVSLERPEGGDAERRGNLATARLRRPPNDLPERPLVVSSACGVCGKASIESVLRRATTVRRVPLSEPVHASLLTTLPGLLRTRQAVFETTGGLHAAGLFDLSGGLLHVREDVGRHNAVDKVVGAALRLGGPCPPILVVSGRMGFEIVQKAVRAGVALAAAVSAPSSLAVELAEEAGLTLVGFLRGETFNVYAHPEGISPST